MPEYSIRNLSDGGIRVRFPDSWTPSKGEGGKPGGGLRAAPFLFFPYPLGGWELYPRVRLAMRRNSMRAVHTSSLADEKLLSLWARG